MYQVHTGAYVSLLALGKTDYTACPPGKTTTYTLHVVPIITNTHDRRKSIGKKKQRKQKKIKEQKDKEENKRKRKGKKRKTRNTRNTKNDQRRRGSKERKIEKKSHTSRP